MQQIVLVLMLGCLVGCAREDAYYVKDARIGGKENCSVTHRSVASNRAITPEFGQRTEHYIGVLLGEHCIAPDKGKVVFRYVKWRPSPPFISDMEEFLQLSIEVPDIPSSAGEVTLFADKVKVYFSESGYWVENGSGWFGESAKGSVRIRRSGSSTIEVSGSLAIAVKHAREDAKKVRTVDISGTFHDLSLDRLRLCLGGDPKCPAGD